MKSQERVLIFLSLILLAGVILFDVMSCGDVAFNEAETQATVSAVSRTELGTSAKTEVQTEVSAVTTVMGKININTADVNELKTLSGIGDVKAKAIVAYRDEHGAFSSPNELVNVSGIGEKTLAMIIDKICV